MDSILALTPAEAANIVEQLRRGLPSKRNVRCYSVGYDKLVEGIQKRHLDVIENFGKIRFVSGSWGSGKTHFFSLLREAAFESGCLVADVELTLNEAPLNKFERVFYSIVRNIVTPNHYADQYTERRVNLFDYVLQEALGYLSRGEHRLPDQVTFEDIEKAGSVLFQDKSIDIDFKTIVRQYWQTYLATDAEPMALEETRERLLQWFSGEGKLADFRKQYSVSKMVEKTNAKLMLRSLVGFVRLAGYRGLVILFDEAEQSYSVMRRSALKDAQNNLLTLINTIEEIPGLLLIYATTPDFYTHEKYGIKIYGALAGRIGQPPDHKPRALDTVWNLDQIDIGLEGYQAAAEKVLAIYGKADVGYSSALPSPEEARHFVSELLREHPRLSPIRFWRVLMTAWVSKLDDCTEGEERATETIYDDVMSRLKED